MIYEFRSRATGSIVMTGKVAERMLGIIGKPAGPQGIITVAQLPGAVSALRAAIEDERRARKLAATARADVKGHETHDEGHDEEDPARSSQAISLEQRAHTLIEMFERAHAAGRDVTWGA
jgi:hypothetical protein